MIYIYRRASSCSARDLADAIGGERVRTSIKLSRVRSGDHLVCWGESFQAGRGVNVLNGGPLRSKLLDALILGNSGVPTIPISQTLPLQQEGWLGRLASHQEGDDLLHPPRHPDFWVKREELVKEYRVHSFQGRSIRAGVKVPRVAHPHTWVRSWKGGWRLSYGREEIPQTVRNHAHAAVKALGLDFGAVDIGKLRNGQFMVLEVNRAPGIEGGTIQCYAKAIQRWAGESTHEA